MTHSADLDTVPFQFTPLREGRRRGLALGEVHKHFNSRPSARGDRINNFAIFA